MHTGQTAIERFSFADANSAWAPERPADYAGACQLGRHYGAELLQRMKDEANPTLLGHVISAMMSGGGWSGVEIGFCHAIAAELVHAPTQKISIARES